MIIAIFWQNDDRVRFSAQNLHGPAYRKTLLQAFVWASIDAVQWKLGPVSKATTGHVGIPAHGWDIPSNCKEFNPPGIRELVFTTL